MEAYIVIAKPLMDQAGDNVFPRVLLPATTAWAHSSPGTGKRHSGGANVVMPNLSPTDVKKQIPDSNDGKICTGDEAAECRHCMERRMESIGYQVTVSRGDYRG